MSNLTPEEYRRAERTFREALDSVKTALPSDAREHIEHHLANAELEIAFESLVLSVHAGKIALPPHLREQLRVLGLALGLDKESVLDGQFWLKVAPTLGIDGRE